MRFQTYTQLKHYCIALALHTNEEVLLDYLAQIAMTHDTLACTLMTDLGLWRVI